MSVKHLDTLLNNTDHPVVERYLIGFVGYTGNLEYATRNDILYSTIELDIEFNIRLQRMGTEFFDETGDLMPTPDNWKAQQLLGFESTYRCVTLQDIHFDIEQYEATPMLWPWYSRRCTFCGEPRPMSPDWRSNGYCRTCIVPFEERLNKARPMHRPD